MRGGETSNKQVSGQVDGGVTCCWPAEEQCPSLTQSSGGVGSRGTEGIDLYFVAFILLELRIKNI